MKSITLPVSIALLAMMVTSCQTRDQGRLAVPVDASGSKVYWEGTAAHKQRAAHLLLSKDDARERRVEVIPSKSSGGFSLVDDWYVLNHSSPKERSLTGWYVHGMNGAVEFRETEYDGLNVQGQPKNLRYVRIWKVEGPEKPQIYWMPSKACQSRIEELPLLLVDATDRLRDFGVNPPPLRGVVNDWFFFADPSEPAGSLTGYYVQGTSGIVQRRVAQPTLPSKHQPPLKTLNYTKIVPIAGPLLPRVYWVGTRAYKLHVWDAKEGEKQARENLDRLGIGPCTLRACVDRYFLFNPPGETSLTGYYANNGSRVEYRVAKHDPLEYPKHPKNLRFVKVKQLICNW